MEPPWSWINSIKHRIDCYDHGLGLPPIEVVQQPIGRAHPTGCCICLLHVSFTAQFHVVTINGRYVVSCSGIIGLVCAFDRLYWFHYISSKTTEPVKTVFMSLLLSVFRTGQDLIMIESVASIRYISDFVTKYLVRECTVFIDAILHQVYSVFYTVLELMWACEHFLHFLASHSKHFLSSHATENTKFYLKTLLFFSISKLLISQLINL